MKALPDYFESLLVILETYIQQKVDHFTLQTYGGEYVDGPYVQALQEHDNVLLIEATGEDFLEPPLDEEGKQKMHFLGWRYFPGKYLPNYAQFIEQSAVSPREIAETMVRALHFGYGVDETYTFEIAPQIDTARHLIKELGIGNG
jgi:hypothetical protein